MEATVKQRLELRFDLWDTDGDGRVSVDDFAGEARRIVEALGESEDSPKGKALLGAYAQMFPDPAKLGGVLDTAGGALGGLTGGATEAVSVTRDQFVTLADTLLVSAGEAGYNAVLAPTIRAIAQLCDTDDDGQVELEDFSKWLDVIGVDEDVHGEAFDAIDTDADGTVSVQQIIDAVRDYHLGRLDAPLLGR